MKILFSTSTRALTGVALLVATVGCETPSATVPTVRPSASATNPGTPVGTDVSIAFQDSGGNARSITIPRRLPAASDRGYDAEGNFVTLGTLKGYAIEAYKSGATSREMEARYKLNRFDGETIEIVVTALHRAGASAAQPLR